MEKNIITDTTDFFSIEYGDKILIGDKEYLIKGHERERRFGIEDPKFWVKLVDEVSTGEKKIIKLTYLETFEITFEGIKIKFFRNPDKEGEILQLVQDHPYFMHGEVHQDIKGNNVRVLDIVRGQTFFSYIGSLSISHKVYFEKFLPAVLKQLIKAFKAIRFLHLHGYKHGDIRNDHIIIEKNTGNYVWIDFDYDYELTENPFSLDIFGVGNVLLNAIGMGIHELHMIKYDKISYKDLYERIEPGDFSLIDRSRFVNLQKLFPYIPKMLNNVLMHFSKSAHVHYENIDEVIEDVNKCLYSVF